jgi:sodium-dependent dicarboxylate transporter 2/3/5
MPLKTVHKPLGFVLGIIAFAAILFLPPLSSFQPIAEWLLSNGNTGLTVSELIHSMRVVLALLTLMVFWWLSEAVPLPVTALMPAVVLPIFHIAGIANGAAAELTPKAVLMNYANPVIYLFLGGFLLAAAAQKWKLDRRFTLWLLTRGNLAKDSRKIVLAMMAVSALMSMWISNTATVAMLLPLGLGLTSLMGAQMGSSRFGTAVMLGIAWAASIGGVGTIIGTPPNGIALGILNTTFAGDPTYERITFFDWMKFGVPYVFIFVPIAWLVLMKLFPPEQRSVPGGKAQLTDDYRKLGAMSAGAKGTLMVLAFVVVLWLTNPFWPAIMPTALAHQLSWIDEYAIGLIGGVLMFLIPINWKERTFLLEWRDSQFVDWGTLLLFGGGIALSDAMFKTGLANWIAEGFVTLLGTPSPLMLVATVVILTDFLTEVTSNTAVTSMMVPIMISIAQTTGANPIFVAVACTVAASMAFMLPVATPPNALVYGSGYVSLRDMVRAGFILNMIGWILTVIVLIVFGVWVFGVFDAGF